MQTKPLDWKAISRDMLRCFYVDKKVTVATLTKQAKQAAYVKACFDRVEFANNPPITK